MPNSKLLQRACYVLVALSLIALFLFYNVPPTVASTVQQQNNSFGPVTAAASSQQIICNYGGANFSQCGYRYVSNGTGEWGTFVNFGGVQHQWTLFDFIGGNDRIEAYQDSGSTFGRLLLQAQQGFVGVGGQAGNTPEMLSVSGGVAVFDTTSLAAESLTTGSANFTYTNDCASPGVCTFAAGTASTIQQASGTLAIKLKANRIYQLSIPVSGVTGTPTATLGSNTCNAQNGNTNCAISNNTNGTISNGTLLIRFRSVAAPTNFNINTTLIGGQAFTVNLATMSLKEVLGGNEYIGGKINTGYCASSASPAVCVSYPAGAAAVPAAATTVVVNTTTVTANSSIIVVEDQSLGTQLSVTCNAQSLLVLGSPRVTARSVGTSFTVGVDVGPTINPLCFNYWIVN
jgi:hypothetical protein